jgi:hypothetical protein
MNRTRLLACLVMGLVALPALAQEKKAAPKKGEPDPAAMMEAMKKYATPGEAHQALKPIVGSWTCTVKFWMSPGAPAQESPATEEAKMVMGDRYLVEMVKGNFGGMPFEGQGTFGYDNLKKKYVGAWIDNMGTGIMTSEGTYDAAKKTFTMASQFTDPMTGKTAKSRDVLRIESDTKLVREMWAKAPNGKEYKSMEITYTRKGVAAK